MRSLCLGFDDESDESHVRLALAPIVLNGEVVIRALPRLEKLTGQSTPDMTMR